MVTDTPTPPTVRTIRWSTTIRQAAHIWLPGSNGNNTQLARAAGISRKTLHRYLSHQATLNSDNLQRLATVLGFSLTRKEQ